MKRSSGLLARFGMATSGLLARFGMATSGLLALISGLLAQYRSRKSLINMPETQKMPISIRRLCKKMILLEEKVKE